MPKRKKRGEKWRGVTLILIVIILFLPFLLRETFKEAFLVRGEEPQLLQRIPDVSGYAMMVNISSYFSGNNLTFTLSGGTQTATQNATNLFITPRDGIRETAKIIATNMHGQSESNWFTITPFSSVPRIIDKVGEEVPATIALEGPLLPRRNPLLGSILGLQQPKEKYNATITPLNHPIKKMVVEDLVLDETVDSLFGLEVGGQQQNFVSVYSIDPKVNFTRANVTAVALGEELHKCKDWNFTMQTCYGTWTKVQNLVPGETYSFELTAEDPGFGENESSTGGMFIFFNRTNSNFPKYTIFNGTGFNESRGFLPRNITLLKGDVSSMVLQASPTRYEFLAVMSVNISATNSSVIAMVWNDTAQAWNNFINLTTALGARNSTRMFDAVYYKLLNNISGIDEQENNSVALVVYGDNSATPAYNIWNGSVWEFPALSGKKLLRECDAPLNAANPNRTKWVELAAVPANTTVFMAQLQDRGNICAQVWNGTTWNHTKSMNLRPTTNAETKDFTVAVETNTSDAIVVFESTTAGQLRYAEFNYSGKWGGRTAAFGADVGVINGYLTSASDPVSTSGRILVGTIERGTGSDLNVFQWSGTVVGTAGGDATITSTGDGSLAITFEGTSGRGLVVYNDATNVNFPRFIECTTAADCQAGTFTTVADVASANCGEAASPDWIELDPAPASPEALLAVSTQTTHHKCTTKFGGSNFSTPYIQHGNGVADSVSKDFAIAFEKFVQIDRVDLTPNATAQTVDIGATAVYSIVMNNTGNYRSNFNLTVFNVGGAATASLNQTLISLPARTKKGILLSVSNAASGTFNVTIFVNSTFNSSALHSISTSTTFPAAAGAAATNLPTASNVNITPVNITRRTTDAAGMWNYSDVDGDPENGSVWTWFVNRTEVWRDRDLVAYWRFDTNFTDTTGQHHAGQNTTGYQPTNRSGIIKNGYDFDGTDDFITARTTPALNITKNITILAWIRPRVVTFGVIASKFNATTNRGYIFETLRAENFRFFYRTHGAGTVVFDVASNGTLKNNTWYHVAGTYNGSVARVYLNGILSNQVTASGAIDDDGSLDVNISALGNGSRFFNGILDEIRIYNRTLTAQEIANLYNMMDYGQLDKVGDGEGTPAPDKPVSLWHFDENGGQVNGGQIISDAFGNNDLNGTLNFTKDGQYGSPGGFFFFGNQTIGKNGIQNLSIVSNITIEAWIAPNALGNDASANDTIFAVGAANSSDYELSLSTNGSAMFTINTNTATTSVFTPRVPLGRLTHITATFNNRNLVMYMNGSVVRNISLQGGIQVSKNPMIRVGSNTSAARFYNGSIDDLAIYNKALTPDEINQSFLRNFPLFGLDSSAFSHFSNLSFQIQPNDGNDTGFNATFHVNFTTSNVLPTIPNLTRPMYNETTQTRNPLFEWNVSTDPDDENVTYQIQIANDSRFFEVNLTFNITNLLPNNFTNETPYIQTDFMYFWRVRASDGTEFSPYSDIFNFTIESVNSISLLISSISFVGLVNNGTNETSDNSPMPFLLQNDGNVFTDVTVNGSNLWLSASNPSRFFQFKIRENETDSFINATATANYTNMPITSSAVDIPSFQFTNATDAAYVDINITVPSAEPAGTRSTTVTVTAKKI